MRDIWEKIIIGIIMKVTARTIILNFCLYHRSVQTLVTPLRNENNTRTNYRSKFHECKVSNKSYLLIIYNTKQNNTTQTRTNITNKKQGLQRNFAKTKKKNCQKLKPLIKKNIKKS